MDVRVTEVTFSKRLLQVVHLDHVGGAIAMSTSPCA